MPNQTKPANQPASGTGPIINPPGTINTRCRWCGALMGHHPHCSTLWPPASHADQAVLDRIEAALLRIEMLIRDKQP